VIALIDYGAGNLTSVKKALAAIGADVYVPAAPGDLAAASGVIVPGVGHFGATRALDGAWREAIVGRLGEGRPLFGICLGMQWLFEGSDEAPDCPGLGLLAGSCRRLRGGSETTAVEANRGPDSGDTAASPLPRRLKIPHVGWNALAMSRDAAIVDGVPQGSQVYFTHSFAAPLSGDTVAATEHGERFAAIVERGQVSGVQFHPEKSGDVGLRILQNFIQIAR
jgi:glutamine amidotransferase